MKPTSTKAMIMQQAGRALRKKPKETLYKIINPSTQLWLCKHPDPQIEVVWSNGIDPLLFTHEEAVAMASRFNGMILEFKEVGPAKPIFYKIVDPETKMWIATFPDGEATWSNEDEPVAFTLEKAQELAPMFDAKIVMITKRGGARPGAGRKKKINKFKLQLKLTKGEYDAVIAKGGEMYLRSFIRKDNGLCTHINNLYGVCSDCGVKLDELQ